MTKVYHALCVVVCVCLVSLPAIAQKSESNLKGQIESSAQYWAGVSLDYFSTRGKKEKSPLIRSSDGKISAGKYFAINGGVYAATFLLDRKHPKIANWTRRIIGWVHFGVGVRNLRVQ